MSTDIEVTDLPVVKRQTGQKGHEMKKQEIKINVAEVVDRRKRSWIHVMGYPCKSPYLAIHKSWSMNGWTIAHLPTGREIAEGIPTLRLARKAADVLAGIDWSIKTKPTAKFMDTNKPVLLAALEVLNGSAHGAIARLSKRWEKS